MRRRGEREDDEEGDGGSSVAFAERLPARSEGRAGIADESLHQLSRPTLRLMAFTPAGSRLGQVPHASLSVHLRLRKIEVRVTLGRALELARERGSQKLMPDCSAFRFFCNVARDWASSGGGNGSIFASVSRSSAA